MTIKSVDEDMEKLEIDGASEENSLAVPQKVKHRVTTWSSNSTPRNICKRNENMSTQNLYKSGHSGITHNS